MSSNARLIAAVFLGSLGGLVFGFDLGALSAASQSLRSQLSLTPWAFGLTISSSVWGTVAGSILAGRFADRFDRRKLIASSSLIYALAACGIALATSKGWLLILAMRFLCGVAVGGLTVGCPLYLSEIAPASMRGRVVGVFQVQVGIGVIAAFCLGAALAHCAPSAAAWKPIFAFGSLSALALLILTRWMPPAEMTAMRTSSPDSITQVSLNDSRRSYRRLFQRSNTRLILLATSIAVFNQFSGVNVLLLYMLQILASAGLSFSLGYRYTVLISLLSLAITMLGIAFVDRIGRKPLLYFGSAGMAVCLLALGLEIPRHLPPAVYLSLFVAYNAFFAFSQGTVVWVYLSELFPPGLRGVGQGYGATVHWVVNAVLITLFPRVEHASSVRFFYIFASMMLLQILVIRLWYPETTRTELGTFATEERSGLH